MKDRAATIRFFTEKLGMKTKEVEKQFQRSKSLSLYHPIVIKEDASMEDVSIIEAHQADYPEIQLRLEPRRLYRYGRLAAHVLGYLGEVTETELTENIFPGATSGSLVGQSGVERIYNQILTGQDGERQVLVDSRGRIKDMLEEKSAVIGKGIKLTLDLDIQTIADKALDDKVGAIVVMDPRNGEILAMASSPSYDPNAFSGGISEDAWNALINNPDHPMQNRAIQNSYSPGSLFKVVMANAGFEAGILNKDMRVTCKGSAVYYNRTVHCASKQGHGTLRLEDAIAKSCNIFFYELGKRLEIARIAKYARALGLGELSGIDLPGEKSGLVPSPEWKERTRGEKWYAGETISVSIGQGALSTTPLQILRAISAIATGGQFPTPHVLLRSEDRTDNADATSPLRTIPIQEEGARRIREGMWASVNDSGTSHNAAIPGLDICGKTGTAQVVSGQKKHQLQEDAEDHSWFAGFANKNNPEIAVVVFIEHGGKGGIAAAPIAREIFGAYFSKHRPKVMMHLTQALNTND